MRISRDDIERVLRVMRLQWKRATRGTSRATGVLMCLLLLSAAVVGGAQVMPFAEVPAGVPSSTHSGDSDPTAAAAGDRGAVSSAALRQLQPVDYNESWRQAGTDWDRLGTLERRHQVVISQEGRLTGRLTTFGSWQGAVAPLSHAAVHLMQNGRVAAETETDASGRFVALGLSEGTYSLIAESDDGLLAYSLHLRVAANEAEASEFTLDSMAATAWDADAIVRRVLDYWQSGPPIERTAEPSEELIPEAVKPIPQAGVSATSLSHHQVHLQADGRLLGRLRRLHPVTGRPIIAREVEVAIFRNGSLQGVTWTDEIGYFELPRVAPGVYSLVATGVGSTHDAGPVLEIAALSGIAERGLQHGFLAIGIQVLPSLGESSVQPVAFTDQSALEIDAALVDLADLLPFLGPPGSIPPAIASSEAPFANAGGTTGGAGSASGGGGVGGGSGWGAVLAAGAAAGLTALLLDDDDVISPARP